VLGHTSRYITLSHCWGKDKNPSYRTTTENVTSRLKVGIPWRELPPTFQDAILAARYLRIPYLWIDSLCIIQEGVDCDWAVESSKMADIYMNSFLSLSATSASSSGDGLTSSFEVHPRIVKTSWSGERGPGWYRIIDLNFWRDRVADAKVNTRGWVLQERTLAASVLHFCFDQLVWECCEFAASEEFPDGLPVPLSDAYSTFKQKMNILRPALPAADRVTADDRNRATLVIWHQAVTMYGRCDLTEPDENKLVAISGLAKIIRQQLNGNKDYLAGLWRENIYRDLLWKVDKAQRHIHGTAPDGMYSKRWDSSKRASSYRAPSWFWASVDGLVHPMGYLDVSGRRTVGVDGQSVSVTRRAKIREATTSPKHPDNPFGQVTAGRLKIQGRLYRLGSKTVFYGVSATIFRSTGDTAFDEIDEPVEWSIYDEAYFLPLVVMARTWEVKPRWVQELDELLFTTLSMYPQISNSPSQARHSAYLAAVGREGFYDQVAGIVLSPTANRQSYRRIGFLEVSRRKIDSLDKKVGILAWKAGSDGIGTEQICTPDMASTKGDVVVGIFEID
jgi:hypothetical protein